MDFKKEFISFLQEKNIIKFGKFMLSSRKISNFYIDLRMVYGFPHQFHKMIKYLQNMISSEIGFDNFDCIASIPTSGLVIASALSFELLKPLIYIRNESKLHGIVKSVEGITHNTIRAIVIDDVITTGRTIENCIKILKNNNITTADVCVIIDRSRSVVDKLDLKRIKIHSITNIIEISTQLNIKSKLYNE